MEKIAIIGSPGAGKTTLAKDLQRILKIKVYHLARLFWRPKWQPLDRESRIDILQKLVQESQWIIEGTYILSSEPRLNEADTIIFLDIPFYRCFWRTIQRHWKVRGQFRRDIPEQSVDKLDLLRIYKLLMFPILDRKQLKQKLLHYNSKQIVWLHSAKEVKVFLEDPELYISVRSNPPNFLSN